MGTVQYFESVGAVAHLIHGADLGSYSLPSFSRPSLVRRKRKQASEFNG